jgi:hypothetical protein
MEKIRDVYPVSDFFPSRIRIKEFKYFYPKKWFLSSRKYYPGCSSRIRILTFYPSRIQGSKMHRIRIRNAGNVEGAVPVDAPGQLPADVHAQMALPARIPAHTAEHRCSWQREKKQD